MLLGKSAARLIGILFGFLVAFLAAAHSPRALAATAQPAAVQPPEVVKGRRALEAGRADEARKLAEEAVTRQPASLAATTLKIEAEAALDLPQACLDSYETWQRAVGGTREETPLVARIARAYLWHVARAPSELAAADAAGALAAAGDREARATLNKVAELGVGSTLGLAALRVLAGLGDEKATSALVTAASSGTGNVRASALTSLPVAVARRARPAVLDAIGERSLFIRLAAISAAGRLEIADAVPLLVTLLDERPFIVALNAAVALKSLGSPRADATLQTAIESELPDVRLAAAQALSRGGPGKWTAAIQPLLTNRDGLFRLQAAELLLPIDRDAAMRTLTEATTDANVVVRNETARILAAAETTPVAELRRLLRDGSVVVQVHAASRLLRDTVPAKDEAPAKKPEAPASKRRPVKRPRGN